MSEEDRYVFIAEWYDPNAALQRRYQLLYYTKDGSVEMYDVKNHRVFLRRTKYDDLHKEDLFVGNKINVFSRQLHLVDYGDQFTARKVGSKKEKTLALIKPDAVMKLGSIIETILDSGFTITKAKMVLLSRVEAMDFYNEHHSKSFFNVSHLPSDVESDLETRQLTARDNLLTVNMKALPPLTGGSGFSLCSLKIVPLCDPSGQSAVLSDLINFMTSGPIVAMEVIGDEAVSSWRKLLGPTNSSTARSESPQSIRARFGTDGTKNAAHGSDAIASAARELEFFFPSSGGRGPKNTAKFTDCTCCIIKPHAVLEGLTGKILNAILDAGFEISAMQMFTMERANVEEFYEVYKGVVAEYNDMLNELCSGPCIALEIRDADAPKNFREFCGPADPEIARHLRPRTLRARFGKTKIKNAVHCTDLPEDALLEVQYFFKILDN